MNDQEQIINRLALRIAQLEVDLAIALAQAPTAEEREDLQAMAQVRQDDEEANPTESDN